MPSEESHELPSLDQPPPPRQPRQQDRKDAFKGLTARRIASWALETLRPEILSRRKAHSARARDRSKLAWLDGLRGWAALLVCFFHMNLWTHKGLDSCYGADLPHGGSNVTPAAWPFIRIIWSGGHFSVMVFFIISGYVVPKRLVSLLHEDRRADFIASLHSALCRRPLRLFVPVVGSTLVIPILWHATGLRVTGLQAPRKSSIVVELVAWLKQTGKYVFFYDGQSYSYNHHTWSIPIELRGSVSLFAWLFALSRTPHKTRFLLTLALVWYLVFGVPGALLATFFAGMTVAELDLIASGSVQMSLPWDRLVRALGRHPAVRAILLHVVLISALYLGSQPAGDGPDATKDTVLGKCYGWVILSKLIPGTYSDEGFGHRWFWLFWASWLLLFACKEIGWLRRSLEGSFSQCSSPSTSNARVRLSADINRSADLGRNSFALYLVHGPMIGLFSERLFWLAGVKYRKDDIAQALFGHLWGRWYNASWFPFTDSGPFGLEPNYIFCAAVSIVAFLYVAELGTKLLDRPAVRVSRWVYVRFLESSQECKTYESL